MVCLRYNGNWPKIRPKRPRVGRGSNFWPDPNWPTFQIYFLIILKIIIKHVTQQWLQQQQKLLAEAHVVGMSQEQSNIAVMNWRLGNSLHFHWVYTGWSWQMSPQSWTWVEFLTRPDPTHNLSDPTSANPNMGYHHHDLLRYKAANKISVKSSLSTFKF